MLSSLPSLSGIDRFAIVAPPIASVKTNLYSLLIPGNSIAVSAPGWGSGDRRFESSFPDQSKREYISTLFYFVVKRRFEPGDGKLGRLA